MNRPGKAKYYLAGSVALISFLVYIPALQNEFVYWDDNLYIFENPEIRSLDAAFFRWAFLGFHVSNWHPLTWISHAIDYALWGMNPLGHHLTNIIFHAINTALVVLLALTLLETAREKAAPKESFLNDRTILIAAGVTGLLFGVHPVHVESVAWVSERKDLLCALLFLLSIIFYVKYAGNRQSEVEIRGSGNLGRGSGAGSQKKPEVRRQSAEGTTQQWVGPYLLSLGCFFLALMSKPMAVSLPLVIVILDWYPLGRIRSGKELWSAGVEKLPFFVLSLALSVLTMLAQRSGEAIVSVEQIPASIRVLVAAKSLVMYLGKMLLPINLIPFYPYPKDASLFSFEYLSALVLVTGITLVCVIFAGKQKLWLSAWGYYIVTLIPVLGIVQVGSQSMADRYTYLPSLGPFLIMGLCTSWIAQRLFMPRQNLSLKIGCGLVSFLVAVFLLYSTFNQIHIWRDSITLWSYVIEKEPEKVSLAYSQRGIVFGKKGLTDRAIVDLEKAIALNPDNYDAHMNLSVAFNKLGLYDKALESVEKAISAKPVSHEAYIYRGSLYEEAGRFDKAIADYTKAIDLDPSDFEAYNTRGIAFGKMGMFERAIADYSEAIRLNPRYIDAHSNRGIVYTLTGQYDRALEDFTTAVNLGPNSLTYYNRGSFYRRAGRNELAVTDFQKSCDLGDERACGILRQLKLLSNPR